MQDRVPNSPDISSRLTAISSGTDSNSSQDLPDRRSDVPRAVRRRSPLGFWSGLFLCGLFLFAIAGGMLVTTTISAQAIDQNNILLDFSASWCGPCQQMSPLVSKLEREGLPIRKVDIDQERALANQYNIQSIPCFVLIANGRELVREMGPQSESTLRKMIKMLPKSRPEDAPAIKSAAKDKKLIPKIQSLFPKAPETKLASTTTTMTNNPDTFRGQTPGEGMVATGLVELPMAASTRIRVKDGSRVHFGSGTIIDSQSNRAVILTCGHIFRDLGKDAVIEVDYYTDGQSQPQTVVGRILKFDASQKGPDLGLLEIPCSERLAAVKLGFAHSPLAVGDRVISIGCGGGARPSVQQHQITTINRYIGPDNIECNGSPQLGRSGGGLFRGSEIVGVCIAADRKDERRIYTGLKPVAELLGRCKLDRLLPSASSGVAAEGTLAEATPAQSAPEFNPGGGAAENVGRGINDEMASLLNEAGLGGDAVNGSPSDYVGAEIVFIVRPKTPGALSRIVIVHQASEKLAHDLLHESTGSSKSGNESVQASPRKKSTGKRAVDALAVNDTKVDLQKPTIAGAKADPVTQTVETSFEPQRYRRKRN